MNIGNNINISNNHNNFAVANRSYHNNWHHGNWNANNWGGGWGRPGGWGGYGWGYGRGYAAGFWNGYWNRPWYAGATAWGLGAWALGSVIFDSGYAAYSNPYYVSTPVVVGMAYDYSTPIQVVAQQPVADIAATGQEPTPLPPEVQEGTTHVDLAREAFRVGDYAPAMREIDLALAKLPKDAELHELRALVLFATKDYRQAAGALYAVMSAGPGWDWTTLSSMYPSVDTYTNQLRDLEDYVKGHPDAADARFVLAYHYITCNHTDAAIKQLKEIVRLQPSDRVSAQMLKMLGGDAPPEGANAPSPEAGGTEPAPGEEPPEPPAIDAAKIVGTWTAKRPDGATFVLKLTADSKFTWTFTQSGKPQEFGGTYSVDGAVLVLQRSDGATMPGMVTMDQSGKGFNFKLYGGPESDPGLDFKG